ncbi:MAG: hypothetical protein HY852_01120 [Bradyrhizobium sp.]|uniref:hypothetical protein n=1 Tax=Bradyrhizobium sp. TaxID=376 RepID=UPI0025B9490A|nr:hypothetical protein [Bradyrhizobium sp.]MBI5260402.1 hypothetical protein [Bradyrhizobium sp.]
MLSTLNRQENDPHDVLEIEPDIVAALRAAKGKESATLAPDAAAHQSTPPVHTPSGAAAAASAPQVDTTFRAAAVDAIGGKGGSIGKWAIRALFALSFAAASAFAAAAWHDYGDGAQEIVANWMPSFALSSSTPEAAPASADQRAALATPAPAAKDTSAQGTEAGAITAAELSSDSSQLLQSLANDLAAMGQQIEELKAAIQQLKAGHEQMSRDIAKTAEARPVDPNLRANTAAAARPAAANARKPKPSSPPMQAAAVPPLPRAGAEPIVPQPPPAVPVAPEPPQATTQPNGEPVLRPPMPLR